MLKEFGHLFDWLAPNLREEQLSKQTLRGTIAWSYNLLSEKEQILLRRLAVFSGGRTAETVKGVCVDVEANGPESSIHPDEVFDLLIQLTDQSLLFTEAFPEAFTEAFTKAFTDSHHEEVRFNFLETIHEFAREKLQRAGEEITMRNRHLSYFCQMAEQFELEIERENQAFWLDRIEIEHNNMRAALDWSLKEGADTQTGARLAASLGLFWYLHSHFVEGLERSKKFLEKARGQEDESVLAKLLYRTADLHLHQAEFDAALRLGNEAVSLCKKIDNKPLLAWALYVLGDIYLALHDLQTAEQALVEGINVCHSIGYEAVEDISLLLLSTIFLRQGELEKAHKTILEGLALAEKLSDPWSIASGLQTLGEIFRQQKKYEEARLYFERSLEASRIVGDKIITGGAFVNLAVLTNLQKQFAESDHYAEEALSIFQLIGDETKQPFPMRIMGYPAAHAGNLVRARVLMRESLIGNNNLQDMREQLACLIGFAYCSLREGNLQEAITLCALAEKHCRSLFFIFHELDDVIVQTILQEAKTELGAGNFDLIYTQGKAVNLEDLIKRLMI